jgi:hypothetical protein
MFFIYPIINLQTDIKDYVKKNFLLEKIHLKKNKIFIKNYRSLILL